MFLVLSSFFFFRGLGSTVEALGLKVSCFHQHIKHTEGKGPRHRFFLFKRVPLFLPNFLSQQQCILQKKIETTYNWCTEIISGGRRSRSEQDLLHDGHPPNPRHSRNKISRGFQIFATILWHVFTQYTTLWKREYTELKSNIIQLRMAHVSQAFLHSTNQLVFSQIFSTTTRWTPSCFAGWRLMFASMPPLLTS